MKKFLKKDQLQLINGGYLSDSDGNPVTNEAFVDCQKKAEYIMTFYEMSKGKDFKGKQADSIEDLKREVLEKLDKKNVSTFLETPEAPKRTVSDKLARESKEFMEYLESSNKVENVNKFLQDFNVLKDFEEFGLFFEEGIEKLDKIYTVEEVTNAVKEVIDLLD